MVSLTKEEAVKAINLRKEKVVSLVKKNAILDGQKARVGLVLDYSGSMGNLYKNGVVQNVIERIIPLALQFDNTGVLDFWIFESGFKRLASITLDNFYGLAEAVHKKYNMGGTRYSPVMKDVFNRYINEEPDSIPNYIIFITDGDCSDSKEARQCIRKFSGYPIFWLFIGIGSSSFSFLESLDDMQDRVVDNADFFSVNTISTMSDDDLYTKLLNEFPKWLLDEKVRSMVNNFSYIEVLDVPPDVPEINSGTNNTLRKKRGLFGLFKR